MMPPTTEAHQQTAVGLLHVDRRETDGKQSIMITLSPDITRNELYSILHHLSEEFGKIIAKEKNLENATSKKGTDI